jgi:hypothetical protein
LDEEVARLVLEVAFPGSEINFASMELIIIPAGRNPAEVRRAISKIPGMDAIHWLEGGAVSGKVLSWDSD